MEKIVRKNKTRKDFNVAGSLRVLSCELSWNESHFYVVYSRISRIHSWANKPNVRIAQIVNISVGYTHTHAGTQAHTSLICMSMTIICMTPKAWRFTENFEHLFTWTQLAPTNSETPCVRWALDTSYETIHSLEAFKDDEMSVLGVLGVHRQTHMVCNNCNQSTGRRLYWVKRMLPLVH